MSRVQRDDFSLCTSKFESDHPICQTSIEPKFSPQFEFDMPPSEDSNSDVLRPARRTAWVGSGARGQVQAGGGGAAEAAEWDHHHGDHGGDRLAGAFGARLPGRGGAQRLKDWVVVIKSLLN
jgi:hypothetical protein